MKHYLFINLIPLRNNILVLRLLRSSKHLSQTLFGMALSSSVLHKPLQFWEHEKFRWISWLRHDLVFSLAKKNLRSYYGTRHMPKTSKKVAWYESTDIPTSGKAAWHEPTDMSISSATSFMVIRGFFKTIFFTASTLSPVDVIGRPERG